MTEKFWFRPSKPKAKRLVGTGTYPQRRNAELRRRVLNIYGAQCKRCGFASDIRVLQLDHVQNDGKRDGKRQSGYSAYTEALNDTEGRFQILCANCNLAKYYDTRPDDIDRVM